MTEKLCFLIDDDYDDREIFLWAMQEAGLNARLVTSTNGQEALDKLEKQEQFTPDYIFLDLNMPLMGGKQFIHELKKTERLRDIPVYIYSTSSQQIDQAEMAEAGAKDFIVKPHSVDKLVSILTGIIK